MVDNKEAADEPRTFLPWLWRAGAMGLVALVTWLGGYASKQYDRWIETQAVLEKRLAELEQDRAKWITLSDLEEKQIDLRIQVEILRQVFGYEYGRNIPTGFPQRPGQADLKPPAELFRDLDKYKAMQQQKVAPKR